jgi:hypothetical protein
VKTRCPDTFRHHKYKPTTEVFGILPIPKVICSKSEMLPYIQDSEVDIKHLYLASTQGIKFAVLNIHTAP